MGLKLAKKFNGELVSADSRAIYQGMDIGTAKTLNSPIPHHLTNIISPTQQFTVAQFKKLALKTIKDIQFRKKIPFLAGGTGLYISSIVDNLKIPQVKPNYKLREKLALKSKEVLYKKLLQLDPTATNFVDKDNPRRLIRAIEICRATKKPFKELRKKGKSLFDTLQIGIKLPNDLLRQAINKRVNKMIRDGLVDEVKQLYKKYGQVPGFNSIGYKEIISYLKKEITLKQAQELIRTNTYHYAKRQITWFKRDKRIIWIGNINQAEKITACFLKSLLPI